MDKEKPKSGSSSIDLSRHSFISGVDIGLGGEGENVEGRGGREGVTGEVGRRFEGVEGREMVSE